MINFPKIIRLDVDGYGLYPGLRDQEEGLHIDFKPGLTLILGANGLGKSTLINIIFRMLTGPYDIPGISNRAELGNRRLDAVMLSNRNRKYFAHRVVDGAEDARGCLRFSLGSSQITVTRRLKDLSLESLYIDGELLEDADEERFQSEIISRVGTWSFGDWILVLRHLVFYFEDRRALVWDPSAQLQVLRILFLPPSTAQKWTEDSRAILELDSRYRNLSAVLQREERALSENINAVHTGADFKHELRMLEKFQEADNIRRDALEAALLDADANRQSARLRLLKAEQNKEAKFRELEHAKLQSIAARFPTQSDTARYILAQLMTEDSCLVCGGDAPQAASLYSSRVSNKKCIVCNSDHTVPNTMGHIEPLSDIRIVRLQEKIEQIDRDLLTSINDLRESEEKYNQIFESLHEIISATTERSRKIDSLIRILPPDEADIHRQKGDLASLRIKCESIKRDLSIKRQDFARFLEIESLNIAEKSITVKDVFDEIAAGFLLEMCQLVWSSLKDTLGESGAQIDFPVFELEMTGADFPSPVRRSGPEQVSESQREFIDLAFRMALISAAGIDKCGSILIDAPESSLDAVFVSRAANVLSRFAKQSSENRLVITSNLVSGNLIPHLLQDCCNSKEDMISRVIDLLQIAAPTAAVRELRKEYDEIKSSLLAASAQY